MLLPIGALIEPVAAIRPHPVTLHGRYVTLVPLDAEAHGDALWAQLSDPANDSLWTYMSDGPYRERAAFQAALAARQNASDVVFFTIVVDGAPLGYASLMRIDVPHRVVEVGNIMYSPVLQRTAAATEAMYLLARHVFEDLHFRRYEWKCNSFNEPSRRAALRLGFTYEGIFRQHMVIKGRNRDTAWFAMMDGEWPTRKAEFERWLDAANFDASGRQLQPLR